MNTTRTRLAAVAFMGIAAAGLATSTAAAEGQVEPRSTVAKIEIGGLPNLIGFCREAGFDMAKPLDPGDAYSWVCVEDSTGATAVIDMHGACWWHHPAYPGTWGEPLNPGDAFSWRCYIDG